MADLRVFRRLLRVISGVGRDPIATAAIREPAGIDHRDGRLVIDLDTHVALVEDRPVALTEKEYGIIERLSLRKGTILTKEMFWITFTAEWTNPNSRSSTFRLQAPKKIAKATGGHHYIETVWGRGYVLRDPAAPWAAGASTLDENLAERIRAVLAGTARCAKSECSAGCASC